MVEACWAQRAKSVAQSPDLCWAPGRAWSSWGSSAAEADPEADWLLLPLPVPVAYLVARPRPSSSRDPVAMPFMGWGVWPCLFTITNGSRNTQKIQVNPLVFTQIPLCPHHIEAAIPPPDEETYLHQDGDLSSCLLVPGHKKPSWQA